MLISHLHVRNLLSFGDKGLELPLQPLNVLVGPNGSGKSNVLEILNLVRALPTNFWQVFIEGGGKEEWIWKGDPNGEAKLGLQFFYISKDNIAISHLINFRKWDLGLNTLEEKIMRGYFDQDRIFQPVQDLFSFVPPSPTIVDRFGEYHHLDETKFNISESVLSQINDPFSYSELAFLNQSYRQIRLYRNWSFGRKTIFRVPQPADFRNDFLAEDFSNLGLILNKLGRTPSVKKELIDRLQDLYEGLDGYEVIIEGGTVQVFFTEGNFSIPATRLSDGTLRYLTLLAILLDPEPPKLIGLEEPELGLHPDLIPKVADLLVDASTRTQLIVTTHSDILIDALSEQPESVLVCEKNQGQTHIHRLQTDELSGWLEKYRLGELWTIGEIGGTRW